jgi:streptogrisin D
VSVTPTKLLFPAVLVAVSALVTGVLPGMAAAGTTAPAAQTRQAGQLALAAVNALPPTPNTAWGVDPVTGQLLLTVSDAAPAAGVARLMAVADRFAHAVRTQHTSASITEQGLAGALDGIVLGGDSINDSKIICSVGFNVVREGVRYLITAGHCTQGMPDWSGIGPSVVSAFPGTDYGLVRDDDTIAPGAVDRYDGTTQPITAAGTATLGEEVCASGQTTHVTCGEVTGVDQTVDYGDGNVVHGLIETDVHTDHGDSGGPLFDGSTGLGTVSGGDGTTDYFQPLPQVLAAYGLRLAP